MQGKLLIFSAPSGAGKTTIVRHLLRVFPGLEFSVSACSRAKRPGEEHGRDYYFLTPHEFEARVQANEFVEWEEVYPGIRYGTLRAELQRIWGSGRLAVFDVDVKGGVRLKRLFGRQALAVFVMPPSIDELRSRLERRGTEAPEAIARRIARASEELGFAPQFDTVIVNHDLAQALAQAEGVVRQFISST